MKCSHCGARIRKKDLFCSRCGMPVRDGSDAENSIRDHRNDSGSTYRDHFMEREEEGSRALLFTLTILMSIAILAGIIILGYMIVHQKVKVPISIFQNEAQTETEDMLIALLRQEGAGEAVTEPEQATEPQAANQQNPADQQTPSDLQTQADAQAQTDLQTQTEAQAPAVSDAPAPALDMTQISDLIAANSGASSWGVYVYDLENNIEYEAGQSRERMYASATISVPILYTAAALLDQGAVTLNDQIIYVNSIGGRGEPDPQLRDGLPMNLSYYLTTMLRYGDNNCMNCLIDYLTLDRINTTCQAAGFAGVMLERKIVADVTDGSENYVSARDLAQMLKELYNGKFRTIGREFISEYFRIEGYGDGDTVLGRGEQLLSRRNDPQSQLLFLNQNGMGDSRYSETALISDENCAYVISVMMTGESGFAYEAAAQAVSDAVYLALGAQSGM